MDRMIIWMMRNQYPNDMSVSGYDIQEDDTLD